MELLLTCPLCSHPGFSDVDSLRLALISATSRRLVCPVCQDIVLGLDKLTIHLVSHSLHDNLVRACFASSLSTSPLAISHNSVQDSPVETVQVHPSTQNQINVPFILNSNSMHGCVTQMEVAQASPVIENKLNTNSPSYILINFPTSDTLQAEGLTRGVLGDAGLTPGKNLVSTNPTSAEKSNECIDHSLYGVNPMTKKMEIMFKPHISTDSLEKSRKACGMNVEELSTNLNTGSHEETFLSEHSICTKGGSVSHPVENIMISKVNVQDDTLMSEEELSVSKRKLKPTSQREYVQMNEEFPYQKEMSNSNGGSTCTICGIYFKDSHIASLHHQLVHERVEENKSMEPLSPKSLEKVRCWSGRHKKVPIDGSEREGACSPHRFPCHLCSKVFRMRGSLMVHLRVAHTSSSMIGLAARILEGSSTSDAKTEIEMVSNSLGKPSVNLQAIQSSPHESITSHKASSGLPTSHELLPLEQSSAYSSSSMQNSPSFTSLSNSIHSAIGICPETDSSLTMHEQSDCMTKDQKHKLCSEPNTSQPADPSSPHSSTVPSPLMSPPSRMTSPTASSGESPHAVTGIYFTCTVCNKSFNKVSALAQHFKSHEGKQWECDVCAKLFTTKYFLKKHKRLHTGEMPYTCGTCNKSFTFQQSYHKHLLYHSDEKPHTCSDCGRAFKELSTLHNHQRIHTGEKPWACESCGKCFRQRVSYLVHRRIHTGAMPYHCSACGKSFRYKVSQRTHKCTAQTPVVSESTELLQSHLNSSETQRDETAIMTCPSEHLKQGGAEQNQQEQSKEQEAHQRLKDQLKQLHIKQEQQHCVIDSQITDQHLQQQQQQQQQQQHQRLQQFVEQAQQYLQHQSQQGVSNSTVYSEQYKLQRKKQYSDNVGHCNPPAQINVKPFHLPNENPKDLPEENSHFHTEQEQWHIQSQQQGQPCHQYGLIQHQKDAYSAVTSTSESSTGTKELKSNESIFHPNSCDESFPQSVMMHEDSASKASPSVDSNSDLLQDILSMVMSPSMGSASSPSDQMQQLSLTGNVCTEDNDTNKIMWDAEPGTELRRLLYGSYDDDSHI